MRARACVCVTGEQGRWQYTQEALARASTAGSGFGGDEDEDQEKEGPARHGGHRPSAPRQKGVGPPPLSCISYRAPSTGDISSPSEIARPATCTQHTQHATQHTARSTQHAASAHSTQHTA